MADPIYRRNGGFVLLTAAILAALIGTTIVLFFSDNYLTIGRLGFALHCDRIRSLSKSALLRSPTVSSTERIECTKRSKAGEASRCILKSSPSGMFEYENVFDGAADCTHQVSKFDLTEHGRKLSSRGLRSSFFCSGNTLKSRSSISLENLRLPAPRGESMIASAGYFEVRHLVIEEDVLIVSGGDVFIDELTSSSPATLTIVSATGKISAANVHGPLTILEFSPDSQPQGNPLPKMDLFTLGLVQH